MNSLLPESTPRRVILPLLSAFDRLVSCYTNLVLLYPEHYNRLLMQRLTFAEYERECATMRAATLENAEMKRLMAEEKKASDWHECAQGPCGIPLTLTVIGMGLISYLQHQLEQVKQELMTAWWRAIDATIERLNRTYAARGLRFEFGQDAREWRWGRRLCIDQAMWLAVHI